jgi:BMFP domain-containing protein YqiC
MERWEIIATALGIYAPLMAWLALNNIQHGKKISVMENMAAQTDKTLQNIEKQIQSMSNRLDLFLKNELDTLKEILKK